MEIKICTYSEGDDFPNHRPSFFRKHWKAILVSCVVIILGIATLTSIATRAANQPTFTPESPYVYDGANVLDSSVVDTLTQLNETLESQADGTQLYVVTIDSLPLGQTIEDYSIKQAQRIGAGDSEKDNGALYTFVKSTRQDRLEVGYGLEDRLTDAVCAKILDGAHGYYRDGDIKAGIKDLARDVANIIQPDTDIDTYFNDIAQDEEQPDLAATVIAWILFIGIIVLAIAMPNPRNSNYVGDPSSRTDRSHSSSSFRSSRSSHRAGGGHFGGGGRFGRLVAIRPASQQ